MTMFDLWQIFENTKIFLQLLRKMHRVMSLIGINYHNVCSASGVKWESCKLQVINIFTTLLQT